MRRATGPVCIVLQTAPKTTPRPTPSDASLMRERRTQLAPAGARGGLGGGRRGDGVRCFRCVMVVASRLGACVWCERRRRAAAMCKLGALLSRSIRERARARGVGAAAAAANASWGKRCFFGRGATADPKFLLSVGEKASKRARDD